MASGNWDIQSDFLWLANFKENLTAPSQVKYMKNIEKGWQISGIQNLEEVSCLLTCAYLIIVTKLYAPFFCLISVDSPQLNGVFLCKNL